jgi:ABC-type bacteriocin/lantibiotic exporter with double-glycine peptidase domain
MRQIGFALFLQAVSNAALLAVGGWLVVRERLTPGQLVAAQLVVALVVASFAKFGKQLESYYDLLAAIDKLGSLTDLPLERGGGTEHRARSRGASLALHDVDFGYDERKRILSGFRVDIAPGECIAIVGPNGSGKSTLGELLFGLRSPDRGRIEIDGVDLRDVTLASFRSHAALVQGVEIFEGSLLANVRMGREGIGLEEVRDALRAVGLLDAVLGLPQGLLTPLWTGGRPLSLGQANRLMLARAMVGQPRLLILDESLDLLDPTDRDLVLHSLMRPEAPWTLVMITHRPDLAALCQRQIRLPGPDSIPERAP